MQRLAAGRMALWALCCCCCHLGGCIRVAAPTAPSADAPASTCGVEGFDEFAAAAEVLLGQVRQFAEIHTRHAVMVLPGEPFVAGEELTAASYAVLPRMLKDGLSVITFTKFVVVGHGEHKSAPDAISVGDDVCGGPGFADEDAVRFLRATVNQQLGVLGPRILKCVPHLGSCPERISPEIEEHLPFLSVLTNHSLPGNVLPIMMQTQTPELGVGLGDALALLAASGGVWHAEHVLFVFGADLSAGLDAEHTKLCDERTLEVITGQGVPQIAKYFADLWAGKKYKGDCGPLALPRGYASLLAAARVAATLGLDQTRSEAASSAWPEGAVHHDPRDVPNPMLGLGAALFWKDGGLPGERLAAQQGR